MSTNSTSLKIMASVFFTVICLFAMSANAAIYVNFDNLRIKGNVTAEGYQDWIRIESYSLGASRNISTALGGSVNREASLPNISEVTLSKILDSASVALRKELVKSSEGVKVLIHFVRTSGDKIETYFIVELDEALVSSVSMAGGAESTPSESLSLNFTKIKWEYKCSTGPGSDPQCKPDSGGYDLRTGKPF